MSDKIKVLHIIKSLGRGGAEMLLPETLKLHHQDQFEFHYIYFLPWKNQLVEAIEQAGGTVHCFAASNNLLILAKCWKISRYIKTNRIELVHAHLPWAGFVSRLVHIFFNIPVIYTEHNKQERYHFITRLLNRLSYNWQSAVIAVSADVAHSIHKTIAAKIPVKEISNGVNTIVFQRDEEEGKRIRHEFHISPGAIVVGTIAVFRFQKRLKEWVQVFAKASQSCPELIGIIIGDGPLRSEIEQEVVRLNLKNKIIMAGLQTNVKPWLSAMDVFMMSSVFEGLPIALLEAMSMQCAIVTTDAGGIKEVIQHNRNGALVEVSKWELLSTELIRLVQDADRRRRLAEAARERVKDEFGMERMVSALEELYLQIRVTQHR